MSPVDTRAARRPTHVGHDALTRLAVRLSWLYTLSAAAALVWVAADNGSAVVVLSSLAVLVGFAVNALVVAQVCRSRSRSGIVAVTLTNAIAPAAVAVLGAAQGWDPQPGQLIAATAATAGGMATALAIGPVLGLHTAFVSLVFIGVGTWLAGGTPSPMWLLGCVTGTVVAAVIGVLARRSFRIADAAIVGADEAAFAAEVSKRRWAARRAVDRQMHDTVLTTFSLLAHGDPKTSPEDLREQAHRDMAVLEGHTVEIRTPPSGLQPDGTSPTPLDELAESWRINGLKVSTHGTPWHEGVDGLGPAAVQSLLGAVRELLSNVARHADTETADITLSRTPDLLTAMVVDSGRGFDPQSVPKDRLGLAESVHGRVIDLGGSVTVFSRAGEGTTVVLGVPVGTQG